MGICIKINRTIPHLFLPVIFTQYLDTGCDTNLVLHNFFPLIIFQLNACFKIYLLTFDHRCAGCPLSWCTRHRHVTYHVFFYIKSGINLKKTKQKVAGIASNLVGGRRWCKRPRGRLPCICDLSCITDDLLFLSCCHFRCKKKITWRCQVHIMTMGNRCTNDLR